MIKMDKLTKEDVCIEKIPFKRLKQLYCHRSMILPADEAEQLYRFGLICRGGSVLDAANGKTICRQQWNITDRGCTLIKSLNPTEWLRQFAKFDGLLEENND